jgi:hypothetical protein
MCDKESFRVNKRMRKKDCIYSLNEILEYISENEVFEEIARELNIPEEDLEIIVTSIITDIDNDECKR